MTDGRTGRLPPAVYRRRRLVVLVLALVVVGALVALGAWAWGQIGDLFGLEHDEAASPPATTTTAPDDGTTTPATEPTTPAAEYPDCAPPALTVSIQADSAEVAAGAAATFTVTIANAGSADCVVDAGEAHRQVVVVSGSDRVWASTDCVQADAPARTLLLTAGASDTTQLAWNRERSAEGCPGGLPAPQPGTYQASVNLAGTSGGPTVFVLH